MADPASVDNAVAQAKSELPSLPENLRLWTERHLIQPREVTLWCDPERTKSTTVWLLTDHVGDNDSSSRIVFDPAAKAFGREMTLEDGTEWYTGPYEGGFADVVRSM
jgi:hypothetical protein